MIPLGFRRNPLAGWEERGIETGMKKLLLCTLAFVSLLMGSCNTFIGLGRDMRLAGEGMEKTATKATGGTSDSAEVSGAPIY
jgi:predicted small secreted protein